MTVLDIGSGSYPNARADLLCERDLTDNRHRGGVAITVDRPLVRGDALAIPLRDNAVDFAIASHIAEHVDDPSLFCDELARVAAAGYIETPSPLFEWIFDLEYHEWRVGKRGDQLIFTRKSPRPALLVRLTQPISKLYFAVQPNSASEAYALPSGRAGSIARLVLRVGFGAITRTGVFHTTLLFGPTAPLSCRVIGADQDEHVN